MLLNLISRHFSQKITAISEVKRTDMFVVHMTSVHPPVDTRILYRMCKTLAKSGHEVALVFATEDSRSINAVDGVAFYGVASAVKNRFQRMIFSAWRVYRKAHFLNGDIYHFHDPELIPFGVLLKLFGNHVIYDAHEDYGSAILDYEYLPDWIRPIVAKLVRTLEQCAALIFDGIVAATPRIAANFRHANCTIVQNFPALAEVCITDKVVSNLNEESKVIYVGSISVERGICEMLEAIELIQPNFKVKLVMGGNFSPESLEAHARKLPGSKRTEFLGWCSRDQVSMLLTTSSIGLVVLHPTDAFIEAYPTKLFDYMAAGLPVVASAFPLWTEIVENAQCGLLANPLNPDEIAKAIEWLLVHPEEAAEMGKRGRQAVIEKYNWNNEFLKLMNFYEQILRG